MIYVLLFCLIGTSLCSHYQPQVIDLHEDNWEPELPAAKFLGLSSGASKVVPFIKTSFSCIGRRYGYFADVDNNCQIFHVCHPSVDAKGAPVIYHYSKFCPKFTRFDQVALTCVAETDPKILPCIDSLRFYPLAESRFEGIPVIQKGYDHIPEYFEQKQELIPFASEVIKQKILPTQSLVKTVIAQPAIQPVLYQPVVHQLVPKVHTKAFHENVVTKHVSPIVAHLIKQTNIPAVEAYGALPVQKTIQSEVLPSVLSVSQPQTISTVQTIPKELLTHTSEVVTDQKAIVEKQSFAVKPEEQSIVQSVPQSQTFSMPSFGAEGAFMMTSDVKPGQEFGIMQKKEEGIVERPAQTSGVESVQSQ